MNKPILLLLALLPPFFHLQAQTDSTRRVQLPEIKIKIARPLPLNENLPDVHEFSISAGRKSHLLRLDNRSADLTGGYYRQVFAKVAGITLWENDGSGIQTSVASRGLSPNRSWEFNMRQDGADLAAEAFGYPEAYYTPPLEAVDRIEITRGAASLAFGPQFGGVLNYQLRKARPGAPLRFTSSQTLGSFGTFNSFQSVSGSTGKFFWTGWFHHRNSEGWRDNSRYFTRSGFLGLGYSIKPGLVLEGNITLFNMQSQQAGGLFDSELKTNTRLSHRSRNWLSTPWNMASLSLRQELSENWNYEVKLFGNYSDRNSVGFVKALTFADTINSISGTYNPRQVDRDAYRNAGLEFRNIFHWQLAGKKQSLSTGLRAYQGKTLRKSGGTGNTGSAYDLELKGDYSKNLRYETRNLALFAEQLLQLGAGFSISPGARMEYIANNRQGRIAPGTDLPEDSKNRLVPLLGIAASWKGINGLEVYGNYSQAYRPVTFSELTPAATTETIDPDLLDSKGFNAELGIRGQLPGYSGGPVLSYDVTAFFLDYKNRIGLLGNLRTNIGNSQSKGIEALLEFRPLALFSENGADAPELSLFASGCFMNAAYTDWKDKTADRSGKKVEYAPKITLRSGLQMQWKGLSFSATWNYCDEVYTDALNTESASSNAQSGRLPSWQTLDLSASLGFLSHYQLKLGANNLMDARYATRRSGGYPGPGLLPAQGRNVYAGFSVNF
jgi:Fe(3+) dicitrate transport protein